MKNENEFLMKRRNCSIFAYLTFLFILLTFLASGCAAFRVSRLKTIKVEGKRVRADEIKIEEAATSLPVGERLTYNVSWIGITVGQVTSTIEGIQEINGRKAYRIELVAKTNKLCSIIYPVNSKYISYMDVEDLVTLRHEVSRREGRFKKDAITDFDQENHQAYFINLLDKSEKSFSIPLQVQDTLTAVYYFRTVNADVDEKINYEVVSSEKVYSLYGLIEKKEFIRLRGLGTFESFLVLPYAKLGEDEFKRARLCGYFSTDPSRIPLVGIVKGPIFTKVTVSLSKIENIYKDE